VKQAKRSTAMFPALKLPPVLPAPKAGWAAPGPGECHLWLVPVRRRPEWLDLLNPEERHRADRLARMPAGNVFATSRAVQRLVGSRYLGVPPSDVITDRDCAHCDNPGAHHGRPKFHGAGIEYSVSHTEKWLLMAVTGHGLVGADIEDLAGVSDTAGLAGATLTPREKRLFDELPAARRTSWLLSAWTRKEAAMKLTGLGLQAPPNLLDVSLPTASVTAIRQWPTSPVYLYALGAPSAHVAALATNFPLVALSRYALPDS
jgi:phosphopantetheinyl transferase